MHPTTDSVWLCGGYKFERGMKYGCFAVAGDGDLQILFHCRRQFPEFRWQQLRSWYPHKLARELPDPNPHAEEALRQDDYNEEAMFIEGASDDDAVLPSWRDGDSSNDVYVSKGSNIPVEFQVRQSFQSKEEVVLAVKNYNIRRGVEYKGSARNLEREHLAYKAYTTEKEGSVGGAKGRCLGIDQGSSNSDTIKLRVLAELQKDMDDKAESHVIHIWGLGGVIHGDTILVLGVQLTMPDSVAIL
ncbi:hypothetical protein PIB30_029621 [Stylosanthes scabra]|uniref:Uncharacterized protein n=1 Tax=Stylosanthes scabra TaxID=79078 RepID=A0ABU6QBG0_9FABA|nr:hypothetical protein [Stylosanthes scabra]